MQDRQKLRIAICDDMPAMLEQLRRIAEDTLGKLWDLEIICEDSPFSLQKHMEQVQIAVLDVQMPEQNGIELARAISDQNPECCIIFVSGFVQYVSDVYEVPHLCMVLKEYMAEQLPKYLLRAAERTMGSQKQLVELKIRGDAQCLDVMDICFLERRGHITYINLRNGTAVQTREKISELLEKIKAADLCRCHVSYAVNLRWVQSMGTREFVLRTGVNVPISRANKQMVKMRYFQFLKENI